MADTVIGTTHPLTPKLISKELFIEAQKETFWSKYIGANADSIIQKKTDLTRASGDKVTVGLRMLLTGAGTDGDSLLKGNEEAITFYSDSVIINQKRHAAVIQGAMSEQRFVGDLRREARDALVEWWRDFLDTLITKHIFGVTTYAFPEAPPDFAASRVLYGGDATSTATIDATDVMDLTVLDKAKERARLATPKFRPLNIRGQDYYVVIMHPYQARSLRTNTNAGQWLDIQKYASARGLDNPIFTGSLGVYNGMILFDYEKVPTASNWGAGGNVSGATAVLLGKQAGLLAFGHIGDNGSAKYVEDLDDYENRYGYAGAMILGAKRTVFNGVDYATMAIRTAAAPA